MVPRGPRGVGWLGRPMVCWIGWAADFKRLRLGRRVSKTDIAVPGRSGSPAGAVVMVDEASCRDFIHVVFLVASGR